MTINIQMDNEQTRIEESPKKRGRPPKTASKENDLELIPRAEVDKLIKAEIEKLEKELALAKANKVTPESDTVIIQMYLDKTRITDEEFIKKLIGWSITPEIARVLENKDAVLSRENLWKYIRQEYTPPKK